MTIRSVELSRRRSGRTSHRFFITNAGLTNRLSLPSCTRVAALCFTLCSKAVAGDSFDAAQWSLLVWSLWSTAIAAKFGEVRIEFKEILTHATRRAPVKEYLMARCSKKRKKDKPRHNRNVRLNKLLARTRMPESS